MATKISTNDLTPNTLFMVRGRLKFSRIASFIDGEELRKDIERASAHNNFPTKKPHTKATICDAVVIYNDPTRKTTEEMYAEENAKPSTSNTGGYTGNIFYGKNTGNRLPWIGTRQPDNSVMQVTPEGELANDQLVTFVLRVYATSQNYGVSLDGIIVENGPIQYYMGNSVNALAEKGIIFHPLTPSVAESADYAPDVIAEHKPTPVAQPIDNQSAYSNIASAAPQGYVPPQQNYVPQGQQPIPQGYVPQNQTQAQQIYAPPVQPGYTTQQQNFAPAQPFTPSNMNLQGGSELNKGIRYDPQDRQY